MAQSDRRREQDRARHARDKEKRNAARRAAHAANPERLRAKGRESYRANPAAWAFNDFSWRYGRGAAEARLAANHCESCGDAISGKRKHIDHDHSKPVREGFRGILCGACNCALGYLKDDPNRIRSLLQYLESKTDTRERKAS